MFRRDNVNRARNIWAVLVPLLFMVVVRPPLMTAVLTMAFIVTGLFVFDFFQRRRLATEEVDEGQV